MSDEQTYTMGDHERLSSMLEVFLNENMDATNFDDTDELADKLAHFLLVPKEFEGTPEVLLPKASYKVGFDIWDEETGDHIIKLTLSREAYMTTGDFLKLQNFFWSTVGKAIKGNPAMIDVLRGGGVEVDTDPSPEGGQQAAV